MESKPATVMVNTPTFTVEKITKLSDLKSGDVVGESDLAIQTSTDELIQFKFHRQIATEKERSYDVVPGIFSIRVSDSGLSLQPTEFSNEGLLLGHTYTKEVVSKIDKFFSRLDVYQKYNIDPRRGILLYGPPGTGKSVTISHVSNKYSKDGAVVVVWKTDAIHAGDVKGFLNNFNYTNGANKLILIAEDVGGGEHQNGKDGVSSSMLALLDNIEKTFIIPTVILATTNHPENLLESLTNRPQRFDDVIEVAPPGPEARVEFMEFFGKEKITEEVANEITKNKYNSFTIAHIKEIIIRSAIYDYKLLEAIEQVYVQTTKAKKEFTKARAMGFGITDD